MSLLLRRPTLLRPSAFASTSTSTPLTHLLSLPSPLRIRLRAFHASPRPQNPLITAISVSHDALTSVHALTHLPWSLSIPLFALLLRTTLILPLSIYSRRATIRQIALTPLVQSWQHVLQKESMREVGHLGPNAAQNRLLKKLRRKRKEIYKRYGCGTWKNFLGLAQLPVFLAVMEALRKMCGSHEGVLGMLIGKETGAGVENVDGVITGDGLVEQAIQIPLETSFATEGMLWFPDLLVADPHLVLPFVLSATMLLNVLSGPTSKALWRQRMRRAMGVAALVIGPIMINVPSALLIYWISSSGSAYLQAVLLDRFMPIPKPITPCVPKRPWKSGLGVQRPLVKEVMEGRREVVGTGGEQKSMTKKVLYGGRV